MAPTSSTLRGNDIPEDILLFITPYLRRGDLRAMLCTCRRLYGITVPLLYRTLRLDFPSALYPDPAEVERPIRLLNTLMRSLRHATSKANTSHFYPQFIRSICYASYDPVGDLRALPMFVTILCFTSNLRHLQVDIADDSLELSMDLLRRRGLLRTPPTSILDALQQGLSTPRSLPRLESMRSTKLALVAAVLERHPLKSVLIDHAVPLKDLAPLLPYSPPVSRNTLTKLSLGVYSHESDFPSVIRGIGSTFPFLHHLAIRCPARVGAPFLLGIMEILTDEDILLGSLDIISLNHGGRRRLYTDILQNAMAMVGALGGVRPRLRQIIFGRAMAMRSNTDMSWVLHASIDLQEWPWLLRSTGNFE